MGILSDFYDELQIVDVLEDVESRYVEKAGRDFLHQVGFARLFSKGRAFEREIRIPIEERRQALKAGLHVVGTRAMSVGQYNDLMMSRYSMSLYPVSEQLIKIFEADRDR